MEIPPAGNRGSKLVALGFPVVTLEPWEPDAFAEPLARPVDEALSLSLLSLSFVGVGLFDDSGAGVLRGACDEASLSERCVSCVYGNCIQLTYYRLVDRIARS
jgi:hypothetical protein